MTETLGLDAMQHAIGARQPPPKLIHHSDRGGAYASQACRDVLRRGALRQSMSCAANGYDHAFLQSCFGTIKTEREMTECDDCHLTRRKIARHLAYEKAHRRRSFLDYLSPSAFEAQLPVPRSPSHCPRIAKQLRSCGLGSLTTESFPDGALSDLAHSAVSVLLDNGPWAAAPR